MAENRILTFCAKSQIDPVKTPTPFMSVNPASLERQVVEGSTSATTAREASGPSVMTHPLISWISTEISLLKGRLASTTWSSKPSSTFSE